MTHVLSRPGAPASSRAFGSRALGLPLVAVLVVQTALSSALIGSNTAYVDEADYLWAGSQIWRSGLHTLGFEEYFSGSPMIYPLLASAVDGIGGLPLARLVSLAFMLGTTVLIFATTRHLFTRTAAFFAAGIFAVIAPVQFLGAFATYDAMALFLLIASLWCVVRSFTGTSVSEKHFVAAAGLMLLANMTKYATMLYNPIVVLVALLLFWRRDSMRLAIRRATVLTVIVVVVGAMFLLAAGPGYWRGFAYTTLREPGSDAATDVLTSSARWVGVLAVLALAGAVTCWVRFWRADRHLAAVLTLLAVAVVLAPLNQLRIHEMQSLDKHVGFGAAFAAVAAGYALGQVSGTQVRQWYRFALPVAVVAFAGYLGVQQAWVIYQRWPESSEFMHVLDDLTSPGEEQYLVQDYDLAAYYMDHDIHREQWSGVIEFTYTDPGTRRVLHQAEAWVEAIKDRHFAVIALSGQTEIDQLVQRTVETTPGYVLVDRIRNEGTGYGVGYYRIWRLA